MEVEQRSTGWERLMSMEYDGALPDTCAAIATTGAPTDAELEASYSTDQRVQGTGLGKIDTEPTLYAFAPDTLQISDKVRAERTGDE